MEEEKNTEVENIYRRIRRNKIISFMMKRETKDLMEEYNPMKKARAVIEAK